MKPKTKSPSDHTPGMYWLCHHDIIVEWVGAYAERVAFIKTCKKRRERPRRLRWFRRVQGQLPNELVNAATKAYRQMRAYWRANQNTTNYLCSSLYDTDPSGYGRMRKKEKKIEQAAMDADNLYLKLLRKHRRTVMRLFHKECPGCPWDGKRLVFPGEKK